MDTVKPVQVQHVIQNLKFEIIVLLARKGRKNISEIAKALHSEQSNISHQLMTLKKWNLVVYEQKGKHIYYNVNHLPQISNLIFAVEELTSVLNQRR